MSIFHVDDNNLSDECLERRLFSWDQVQSDHLIGPSHQQRFLHQKQLSSKTLPWLSISESNNPLWLHVEHEVSDIHADFINFSEINYLCHLTYTILIRARYPKSVTIVTAYPKHAKTINSIFVQNRILSRLIEKNA